MVDFSVLIPIFLVLPQVETPTPLPKATVPSLNALRVPVASSKRMFDEGVDVDYDSEEERKTKEDNISVGEGSGKDGEDNRDKNLIGVRLETHQRFDDWLIAYLFVLICPT